MADLKTNYVDDVLNTSVNEKRKYNMVQNADGTVSFDDVTTYTQNGDSFGAKDINDTNTAVNDLNSNLSDINNIIEHTAYLHLQSQKSGTDGTINTGFPASNRLVLGCYSLNGAYIYLPFVYNNLWYLKVISSGNLQSVNNTSCDYYLILKNM